VQFLTEGGLTKCRIVWPEAEVLRLPHRWLPAVAALGHNLPAILRHCQDQANQLRKARSEHFHP
jgi:hypothetical protein